VARPVASITRDMNLIEQAKSGDSQALAELYLQHKDMVFKVCYSMTLNASDAEDYTQDTFVAVLRFIHAFKEESKFSTWLHRIAVNTVLMHKRRQKELLPLDGLDTGLDPAWLRVKDIQLAGAVDRLSIQKALDALPRGYRRVFELRLLEGLSVEDTSIVMGVTTGGVKSQLHKARERMREELSNESKRTTTCPLHGEGVSISNLSREQMQGALS
jgi:RNA polymerase sigma-70 factor, ECF subfamily